MIILENVHKSFGDLEVLKGIDMEVKEGEVLSVIGASGSGKSTMLYCINGLEPIQSGSITIEGIVVNDKATNLNKLRQEKRKWLKLFMGIGMLLLGLLMISGII